MDDKRSDSALSESSEREEDVIISKKVGNCRITALELEGLAAAIEERLSDPSGEGWKSTWAHQFRTQEIMKYPERKAGYSKAFRAHVDHHVQAPSLDALRHKLVDLDRKYRKRRKLAHLLLVMETGDCQINLEVGSRRSALESGSHTARFELRGRRDLIEPIAFLLIAHLAKPSERAAKLFLAVYGLLLAGLAIPVALASALISREVQKGTEEVTIVNNIGGPVFVAFLLGLVPLVGILYFCRVVTSAGVLMPAMEPVGLKRIRRMRWFFAEVVGGIILPKRPTRDLAVIALIVATIAAIFQILSWVFPRG